MKFKALKLIIAVVAMLLPLNAQAEKMGIADPARDKYYSALEGKKVALINFGTRLEECKKSSKELLKKGIDCTIIDARFAKPLDEKLIMEVASNHEVLITIEEGSIGGFGSHVMQFLSDRGVFDRGLKFRSMILPDIFIDQDTPEKMYETAGLDSSSIAHKVEETLNSNIILAKNRNKISN